LKEENEASMKTMQARQDMLLEQMIIEREENKKEREENKRKREESQAAQRQLVHKILEQQTALTKFMEHSTTATTTIAEIDSSEIENVVVATPPKLLEDKEPPFVYEEEPLMHDEVEHPGEEATVEQQEELSATSSVAKDFVVDLLGNAPLAEVAKKKPKPQRKPRTKTVLLNRKNRKTRMCNRPSGIAQIKATKELFQLIGEELYLLRTNKIDRNLFAAKAIMKKYAPQFSELQIICPQLDVILSYALVRSERASRASENEEGRDSNCRCLVAPLIINVVTLTLFVF